MLVAGTSHNCRNVAGTSKTVAITAWKLLNLKMAIQLTAYLKFHL